MARASRAKLMMTRMPTRSSVQASDRRCAIFLLSLQEAFDVFILGLAKHLVRAFENDFSVAEHQESRVRDAEKRTLRLEMKFFVTVRRVFGRERERVAHAVRDENAGHQLHVAK